MRKPEDVPAMYNQAYIDALKNEVHYWKKQYAKACVKLRECKCASSAE